MPRPALSVTPPAELFAELPRFSSLSVAGTGASGVVFAAWDHERDERVAIKVLQYVGRASSAPLARQVEGLRAVRHPNLVHIHELLYVGDRAALVMELVEGDDFMTYVRAGRPAPSVDFDRLRGAVAQLVGALSALHATYRVHRDVKPSNLRVTPEGRLVLLDLGIVADLAELGNPGTAVGTPAYMSPEQVSGEPVGRAADLYALGALLYEVLTGVLPHPGAAQHVAIKLTELPVPVAQLVPHVPQALAELTMALLSRDPYARPSAREVLAAFDLPMDAAGIELPVPLRAGRALVGREREIEALVSAFVAACAGHRGFVHIEAPAGRGKSALLDGLVSRIKREHPAAFVLRGAFRDSADAPYGAVDVLVEALAARLDAESPPATSLEDAPWLVQAWPALGVVPWLSDARAADGVSDLVERRLRAENLLAQLLVHVGSKSPVLVVLDDVDRASTDSLLVLATLARVTDGARILFVTTGRGAAPRGLVGVTSMRLAALDERAARELAQRMQRRAGLRAPLDDRAVITAGGTPRVLLELMRASLLGAPTSDERAAVAARVAALSDKTRQVLRLLSVLSVPATREAVGLAAALDGSQVRAQLAELLDAALVSRPVDAAGFVCFVPASDTVAAVALADVETSALRDMHVEWASALVSKGVPRRSLVEHAERAGQLALAADYARKAAEHAHTRLALATAAELRARADVLVPLGSSDGDRRLLRELAESLALAGQPREAAEVCARAARGAPPAEQLPMLVRRAELLIRAGLFQEGLAAAKDVLAAVGLDLPVTTNRALASLVFHRAVLGVRGFGYRERGEREVPTRTLTQIDMLLDTAAMVTAADPIIGTEVLSRALRRALATGEPRRVARALMLESSSQASLERPPLKRAPKLLAQAQRIVGAHRDGELARAHTQLEGFIAFQSFRMREAAEAFTNAQREQSGRAGVRDVDVLFVRQYLAYALVFLGDFRRLRALYRGALHDAERRGDFHSIAALTATVGVVVELCDDAPEEAKRALDEALARLPDKSELYDLFAMISRWSIAVYVGDVDAVHRQLERVDDLRGAFFSRIGTVRATLDLFATSMRLYMLAQRPGEAQGPELARIKRTLPKTCAYPSIAAEWRRERAVVALLEGDTLRAERELTRYLEARKALDSTTSMAEYLLARVRGDASVSRTCLRELTLQGVENPTQFVRLWGLLGAGGYGI